MKMNENHFEQDSSVKPNDLDRIKKELDILHSQ
jgi:hypothetical protein